MTHYDHINNLLDQLEEQMGMIRIRDDRWTDRAIMAQTFFFMGLLITVLGCAVLLIAGSFDRLGYHVGAGMALSGGLCVITGLVIDILTRRERKRTMLVKGNRGWSIKSDIHAPMYPPGPKNTGEMNNESQ